MSLQNRVSVRVRDRVRDRVRIRVRARKLRPRGCPRRKALERSTYPEAVWERLGLNKKKKALGLRLEIGAQHISRSLLGRIAVMAYG